MTIEEMAAQLGIDDKQSPLVGLRIEITQAAVLRLRISLNDLRDTFVSASDADGLLDEIVRNSIVIAPLDSAVTPEMIEAGRDVIESRWVEFTSLSGFRLWDELMSAAFLAMLKARHDY